MLQVSPRIEEAARGLGKTGWQALWRVTLPLVLPGALAGAALVFLMTMKELPASLILSPIGTRTLATSIWAAASEAYFAQTAAAGPALNRRCRYSHCFLRITRPTFPERRVKGNPLAGLSSSTPKRDHETVGRRAGGRGYH